MTAPHIEFVYCEDLRQELNGAVTLVGVVRGWLGALNTDPLPRLGAVCMVDIADADLAQDRRLVARLLVDDQVAIELQVDLHDSSAPPLVAQAGVPAVARANLPLFLIPVIPRHRMRLCAEALYAGRLYRAEELIMVVGPPEGPGPAK